MTRSMAAVLAVGLFAGAIGVLGIVGKPAPPTAVAGEEEAGPAMPALRAPAGAMLVLVAAGPDRGWPRPEAELGSDTESPPAAENKTEAEAERAKVLPPHDPTADILEIAVLMAAGFALGLGALTLGGVWAGLATAGFSGLAAGAAGFAFLINSSVSQPSLGVAAGLLIFSASALTPRLFGRAGIAAARRVGGRLFGARRDAPGDGRPSPQHEPD